MALPKATTVKLSEIKLNPSNPRVIKDAKYKQLLQSIVDFPQMIELRPIVVDEDLVVLGGNMRLRALKEAGYKEVPIIKVTTLTEEQKKQFIIKDNVSYGEWDMDMLANEWDVNDITQWGIDGINTEGLEDVDVSLDKSDKQQDPLDSFKIILEYSEDEYLQVIQALSRYQQTKESVIYNLLCGQQQ